MLEPSDMPFVNAQNAGTSTDDRQLESDLAPDPDAEGADSDLDTLVDEMLEETFPELEDTPLSPEDPAEFSAGGGPVLFDAFTAQSLEPLREDWLSRPGVSISAFYLPAGRSLNFQATPGVDRLHLLLEGRGRLHMAGTTLTVEAGRALGIGAPGPHQLDAADEGVVFLTLALQHLDDEPQDHPGLSILDLLGPGRDTARSRLQDWATRPNVAGRLSILPLDLLPTTGMQLFTWSPRILMVLEGTAQLQTPDGLTLLEPFIPWEVPPDTPHRLDPAEPGRTTVLAITPTEPASALQSQLMCGHRARTCDLVRLTGDGLLVLAADGQVLEINYPASRWLGLSQAWQGSLLDVLTGRDREWLTTQLEQAARGEETLPIPSRTAWISPKVPDLTLGVLFVPYQGDGAVYTALLYLRPMVIDAGNEADLAPERTPVRELEPPPRARPVERITPEAVGVPPVAAQPIPVVSKIEVEVEPPTKQELPAPPPLTAPSWSTPESAEAEELEVFPLLPTLHPPLQALLDTLPTLLEQGTHLVIVGEPGTGKSQLARALHQLILDIWQQDTPLGWVSCKGETEASVSQGLWTRPDPQLNTALAPGPWLEGLEGGTLLLDDLAELPASAQLEILKGLSTLQKSLHKQDWNRRWARVVVLLDKKPGKAGALLRPPPTRSLEGRGPQSGGPSSTFTLLELPPLRERPEDIPLLLAHLWRLQRELQGLPEAPLPPLSAEALELLMSHPLPRNLWDLQTLVQALISAPGAEAVPAGLVRRLLGGPARATWKPEGPTLPTLAEAERQLLMAALQQAAGNKAEAARLLDIPRPRLYRMMQEYHLEG